MSNTGQTAYKNYKTISVYLSNFELRGLADETVELMRQQIAELNNQVEFEMNEKGLARIKRDEYAKRITELEKELNDTKYLLNISSNMIRALNATE